MVHSKLPWKCSDSQCGWWNIWNTKEQQSTDCPIKIIDDDIASVNLKANAEYIVKACNMFPELVERLEKIADKCNEPEYHSQAMGCGLDDMNITDRYDAMRYGWECAMEKMYEMINIESYDPLNKTGE